MSDPALTHPNHLGSPVYTALYNLTHPLISDGDLQAAHTACDECIMWASDLARMVNETERDVVLHNPETFTGIEYRSLYTLAYPIRDDRELLAELAVEYAGWAAHIQNKVAAALSTKVRAA